MDEFNSKFVRKCLKAFAFKHFPACITQFPISILQGLAPEVHSVAFEGTDAHLIHSMALKASGAAGPSGLNAHARQRLCTACLDLHLYFLGQSPAQVAKR